MVCVSMISSLNISQNAQSWKVWTVPIALSSVMTCLSHVGLRVSQRQRGRSKAKMVRTGDQNRRAIAVSSARMGVITVHLAANSSSGAVMGMTVSYMHLTETAILMWTNAKAIRVRTVQRARSQTSMPLSRFMHNSVPVLLDSPTVCASMTSSQSIQQNAL